MLNRTNRSALRIGSLFILFGLSRCVADTYPRQTAIDVLHYAFRLTLSDQTDEITGEATVEIRFIREGVKEFALDLTSLANGKGMTVSGVTSSGSPARYKHASDRLVIALSPPPKAGDLKQFTVAYHGIPGDGLRIIPNKYGERTFFSENFPDKARQWLPVIDHPYDKATSEFIITAPAKYQVVSNGVLQEQTDLGDGRRVTHWKQSVPIASWLNAIGVAQMASRHFASVRGIPLETWVYRQEREAGVAAFEESSRRAIEFFMECIGPYPYERLGNVEAAGVHGATEHATSIFFSESAFKALATGPAGGMVAHETAHQWFGNSVTEKDWDDVWLSEGFATYFAWLATEHYEGRDDFVTGLKSSRDYVFTSEKKNPGVAVIHDNLSDMGKVLNAMVYLKGGWTLHMLRAQIGTPNFWAGVRDYYRRYRDSNASTTDFRRVMEENAGVDLGWFFDQWLKRPGSPVVEGGWRYNPAAKRIEVELAQTQPGDAFRLHIEIGIDSRTENLDMTQKQQRFEIPAASEPALVTLDPHTWVLMAAHFAKH
jgi:aminopeptidase N